MADILKTIAIVALLLLLFWLFCVTVSAVLASPAPDTMMNGLFSLSDLLGDALCKVFGL